MLSPGPACGGSKERVLAGGAWGLLARAYGLGCDRIRAVTMVDAQGRVVQANSTYNSDLLWASCGGGGGNFGIVTSMRVQVRPHKASLSCICSAQLQGPCRCSSMYAVSAAPNVCTAAGSIRNHWPAGCAPSCMLSCAQLPTITNAVLALSTTATKFGCGARPQGTLCIHDLPLNRKLSQTGTGLQHHVNARTSCQALLLVSWLRLDWRR